MLLILFITAALLCAEASSDCVSAKIALNGEGHLVLADCHNATTLGGVLEQLQQLTQQSTITAETIQQMNNTLQQLIAGSSSGSASGSTPGAPACGPCSATTTAAAAAATTASPNVSAAPGPGEVIWARSLATPGNDNASAVAVGRQGQVLVGGRHSRSFVANYNPTGTHVATVEFSPSNLVAMAVDSHNTAWAVHTVAGFFRKHHASFHSAFHFRRLCNKNRFGLSGQRFGGGNDEHQPARQHQRRCADGRADIHKPRERCLPHEVGPQRHPAVDPPVGLDQR
eukprot:m.306799 g.306799  ORF g.306799 m.306799 type:complete len:284 (+) comp23020_c0_seq69:153-1004(+)